MLLRIYLACGLLVTGFYVSAAVTGLRGPRFSSGRSAGQNSAGAGGSTRSGGYIGGRGVGGSSSTWHGGK